MIGAIALALADLGDDFIGHVRRLVASHQQANHARAQADATPLQLDAREQLAGK